MKELTIRLVGFGSSACDALEAFVSDAKADDPFAAVTVVVRNNYEGVTLRRELVRRRARRHSSHSDSHGISHGDSHSSSHGARRGLVAVSFWTLGRLADELVSARLRSEGLRPADELVVAAAIRAELAADPGMLAAVADHASTEASLARAFAEVRLLRGDQRQRLAESGVGRVREVAALIERVWARLRRQRYYDLSASMEWANDHLRQAADEGAALGAELGRTVVHLPRALAPVEASLVRALASAHETVVHLGVTGSADADRLGSQMHVSLSAPGPTAQAQRACTSPGLEARSHQHERDADAAAAEAFWGAGIEQATADEIVSLTDPDEEVRWVVRAVLEDLDAGVPADDIAVLIGAREPYARSLSEQLDAVGVAWNGDAAATLAESLVGRFVVGLMRLVVDGRMRRVDVMSILAEAPIWESFDSEEGAPARRPVHAAAWERLARTAKVVEAGDWIASRAAVGAGGDAPTRLDLLALSLDAQIAAAESDPEASEARLERLRADKERCSRLAQFVQDLSRRVADARASHTWDELADWLRKQVKHYLGRTTDDDWWPAGAPRPSSGPDSTSSPRGGPNGGASGAGPVRGAAAAGEAAAQWSAERAAAQRIDAIIGRVGALGEIEPAADAALMLRTLEVQLAVPHGHRGVVGAGVFVGSVSSHTGVPRQRLYVLGLAEGIYPSRQLPDSIIGDADRHRGGLIGRSERTEAQHRDLLAALACCPGNATATVPRGDLRRNAENVPSRWLLRSAQRLAAAAPDASDDFAGSYLDANNLTAAAASGTVPGLRVVHSFASGLAHARFPASEAEYDARTLLAAARRRDELARHPLFAQGAEPAFSRGVELWRGRSSRSFTRFDGNLSRVVSKSDALAEVVSASRLEAWATCPRKYLFSYLLGIDEVVEPESIVRLSPIDRGRLIHESLDELLRELIGAAQTLDELPGAGREYSRSERERLRQLGEAKAAQLEAAGATGHPLLWSFDRETMLADLVEVLARDEQRSGDSGAATSGKVVASEHRFGLAQADDDGSDDGAGAPAVPFQVEPGRRLLFRGAIDRVERVGGLTEADRSARLRPLVVIDYKSGSAFPYHDIREPSARSSRPDDPTVRGTKLQLGVYALAAAHHFTPGIDVTDAVAQAAYWFVSGRADWAWVTRDIDEPYFERFAEVVAEITRGIDSGIFVGYARAGDDRLGFTPCPYCDPDGIGTAEALRQWRRKRLAPDLDGFLRLAEGPLAEGPLAEVA